MKLGVLGGTFDPVHIGHLLLAEEAREQLRLERVLFVPAGQPWRKAGRRISAAVDRLAMLWLAVEDNPAFEVSDLEVARPGPSYTAETLGELRKRYPDAELYFILGEDALADLPNWREPHRILELVTLVIARRQSGVASEDCVEALSNVRAHTVVWLTMPLVGISASEIRERVRGGLSIHYRVPPSVEAYIREHRLYRG